MSDLIPYIFHEKQEGQLCAQHALNALLQAPLFTAIDLAEIARELDVAELKTLESGGQAELEKYQQGGSSNYDDSGYFSVQVIDRALAVWDLVMVPLGAKDAVQAKAHPERELAFICNLNSHWFTLRRFGGSSHRWYDLNSTRKEPEYVSETYLSLQISQLEQEGYSVYTIRGNVNESEADIQATIVPIPPQGSIIKKESRTQNFGGNDDDLEKAIAMSMGQEFPEGTGSNDGIDEDTRRAIEESMKEFDDNDKLLNSVLASSLNDTVEKNYMDTTYSKGKCISSSSAQSSIFSSASTTIPVANVDVEGREPPTMDEIRLKRLKMYEKQ